MKCLTILPKAALLILLMSLSASRFLKKKKTKESDNKDPFEFTEEMREAFESQNPDLKLGEEPVGKGGYGLVFKAEEKSGKGNFAVKFIRIGKNSDTYYQKRLNNFAKEMRTTAEIQEKTLFSIAVCGSGSIQKGESSDLVRFLIYPLAKNDLCAEIKDKLVTDPKKQIEAIIQMALAVNDIQHSGLIHRDIKPENFLRMFDDRVVLADFGLTIEKENVKKENLVYGTEVYIPSDWNSKNKETTFNLTPEVDSFALGLTFGEYFIPEFMDCRELKESCIMKNQFDLYVEDLFKNEKSFDKIQKFYKILQKHRDKSKKEKLTPLETFIFTRMLVPLKGNMFKNIFVSTNRATIPEVVTFLRENYKNEFSEVERKYKKIDYCQGPQGRNII